MISNLCAHSTSRRQGRSPHFADVFRLKTAQPPEKSTSATRHAPKVRFPVRSETYPNNTGAIRLPTCPALLMKAIQPADSASDRKPVGMVQNKAIAVR